MVAPPLRAPEEPVRLCSECDHSALHPNTVFCNLFNQPIWDEAREAKDCLAYDRVRA